ncbi:MAG: anthranilate synthase component I family protein [Rickettsiales bacterium]
MPKTQYTPTKLKWQHPLDIASHINEKKWVLLYSGVNTGYSGRHSLLAHGLNEEIISDNFTEFAKKLSSDKEKFVNAWFGYLGYGLKNSLEELENDETGWLNSPNLYMMKFNNIYIFDHEEQTITMYSNSKNLPDMLSNPKKTTSPIPQVKNISSNMTNNEYLRNVEYIIDKINNGDLYQANLTRKFYGESEKTPDYLRIFRELCEVSPACYSAFIRLDDTYTLSSSPESFLNINSEGKITSRPIKGTAPRNLKNSEIDEWLRNDLENSAKDKAENLMIVDLTRNDLSKCCKTGSVKTESLFDITSHATIHHMSSTISGEKGEDYSTIDAVKSVFPPGSMTGTPKIAAMNLCSELEKEERGIYSGTIGWFGGDGSCDLSVVIRTLIMKGKKFEFQVGGAIIADSIPEKELEETINKARGVMLTLSIDENIMKNL